MSPPKPHGDIPLKTRSGHGIDVASQREDFLDGSAVRQIKSLLGQQSIVKALDAACAAGGQALRMARAGATVTAIDLHDDGTALRQAVLAAGLAPVCFLQADLRDADLYPHVGRFDLIMAQRFIHYLRYPEALDVVRMFHATLLPGGKLYISASGLRGALGQHYQGAASVDARFAPLWQAMADKHGIRGPVCLYEERDMRMLLEAGGMTVEKAYATPFGNIKAIAVKATD